MTEAEALESITNVAAIVATYTSLWLSVTFAYLTVAYFVGSRMTRFQCLAASVLYFCVSTLFSVGVVAHGKAFFIVLTENTTAYSQVLIFRDGEGPWLITISAFFTFAAILSFYFMYDVRRGNGQ
ncbi:MAG: hypothetical protein ACU84Q_00450 [Gammaproteobacteria bacterium]